MSEHKLKVYKKEYTVILTPDDTDGGFTVTVDGIPECIEQGDTVEECLKNIKGSILEHLAGIRNAKKFAKMTARERWQYFSDEYDEKAELLKTIKARRDEAHAELKAEVEAEVDAAKRKLAEVTGE